MNEKIVENFIVIRDYHKIKNDRFRVLSYNRAIETLRNIPKITSVEDIKNVKGIGKNLTLKIQEFLDTGIIKEVELIKRYKEEKIKHEFEYIFGVGPVKCKKILDMGINTISELRKDQRVLTNQQKIGLKYYEDLLKKIPRDRIDTLKEIVKYIFDKEFGKKSYKMDFAGSYRRGKKCSGDVDILLSSTINNLSDFIRVLEKYGIIKDTLALKETKFMGIAKCLDKSKPHFRLDITFVSYEEYYSALLYFTGSKQFNIEIRKIAKNKGMKLNEHGLFKDGIRIKIKNEKDIFNKLKLKYLIPGDR